MWCISLCMGVLLLALLAYCAHLRRTVIVYESEMSRLKRLSQSLESARDMLLCWIRIKTRGREIADYLQAQGIKRVAIYGVTEVGLLLWEELEGRGIEVTCGIDRSKSPYGRKTVRPEEFQGGADAVVVAAVYYFSEIYDTLNQKLNGRIPILGLDEVLYELSLSK